MGKEEEIKRFRLPRTPQDPFPRLSGLFVGVPYLVFVVLVAAGSRNLAVTIATAIVLLPFFAAPAIFYAYVRPLRFEISDAGLRIVWNVRTRLIKPEEIAGLELISLEEITWSLRIWPYLHMFPTPAGPFAECRGSVRAYATRATDIVLVRLRRGRSLAIGVEFAGEFIEELRAVLPEKR